MALVADGDGANTLSILVATDNHLGYMERDPIRGQDSFHAFSEIMQLARDRKVDMVLLGGDLFHDNKPSRKCLHQALTVFKENCLGSDPVSLEYLSDPAVDFASNGCVNYEDPNMNISLPVFSIHGNHDDPSGDGNLSAVDMLAACGLVNYFGRQAEVEHIRVSPVLLRKGETRLALYGLGNIRDERLHRTMARNHVTMCQPTEDQGRWFNLMVLHQNRAAHGPKNHIPEHFLSEFLDFIVWGHEHQCLVDPEFNHQRAFYVSQPGSSVATALSAGEASPKHVAVLRVNRRNFKLEKIRLKNVRPFVIDDLVLASVPSLSPQSTEDEIVEYLRRKVERMLVTAQQQYQEQMEEAAETVESALGPQPKPLIRLRVEYSGGFESFHPQRFGLLFADRVANPRDIIYFFRKPRTPAPTTTISTQGSTASTRSVPAPVDAMHVESLIGEFLDDSSMRMLVDLELAEAVRLFVQKGDADAIGQSLKTTLRDTQRRILEESAMVSNEEQLESRIGLTRAARRQHAVESGHGLVDSARTDSVVAVPVVAGKRAAVTTTDRNAIKAFERIAASRTSPANDEDESSGSSEKEDGSDDFRQDITPATRGKRVVGKPTALGKRPRAKPVSDQSDEEEGEDFVASSALQITRPSRNARTTLASASTASRASVSVSEDDVEDSDEASLPSSIVSPPAKRGRGAGARARGTNTAGKRGATGRGRGRGRGASTQRTVSSLASQMPAVAIDDDDDEEEKGVANSRGFGGFSLRKRA
ncbi:meiotic recombination [Coemansia furcata]|uniref:Meiotic recombination n=1 Tax=Coemansia furcata TaxID=417177 RepID=A0ACC1LM43_9FUNG|nr:meiotic recombination [Coemansia furcata]